VVARPWRCVLEFGFVPARGGCPGDAQTKRRARTLRSGV